MAHTKRNRRVFNQDESSCTRLIEALADGHPIPDTSAICPDRQQLITTLAEISKGERSELFQYIQQVAERHELSAQEIASRAAFLLACLDTPGSDDPYAVLGVAPTATDEEIKEAWLSRVSLYHPDRHPENAEWFTRQAARVNEAYHTLKDPVRRHAFDERSRRDLLARLHGGPSESQPVSSASPPTSFRSARLARHRTPALITALSVAAAGLVVVTLSGRSQEEPQLYLKTVQPMAAVTPPSPTPISDASPAEPTEARPRALNRSATPRVNRHPEPRRVKQVRYVAGASDVHTGPSELSDNPTASARSTTDPVRLAQALPPVTTEPKALDRQEIDALLDEYVDAYEKADIDRVMATLSTRVREKGTLDFQAIRNAYVKGFAGRDQIIYRLKNLQVEIKGEQATVTAQYLIVARNAAQFSKGTSVSGRIEWKIQREGEKLKIVAINY